jgi:hypothetical protein
VTVKDLARLMFEDIKHTLLSFMPKMYMGNLKNLLTFNS